MWIVLTVSVHADLLYQSFIYEPVRFNVGVYRVMSRTRRLFSIFVLCMNLFSPVLRIIFFLIFRDIFCDIFCGDIFRDIFRLRFSPTIVMGVCGGLARLYNSTLACIFSFYGMPSSYPGGLDSYFFRSAFLRKYHFLMHLGLRSLFWCIGIQF